MKLEDQTKIKTKQQLLESVAAGQVNPRDGVMLLGKLPDFVNEPKASADFASPNVLQDSTAPAGLPFLSLQLF